MTSKSDEVSKTSKYVDGIHEERFDLFLKDLRSGAYEQGRNTLEFDGKFCCLGVACVRPAALGLVERTVKEYSGVIYYGETSTAMPVEVADYLGIPTNNRTGIAGMHSDVNLYKLGATAVALNDLQGKNFDEIADAFEQEFLREV